MRDNRLLNGTAVRDRILAEVAERTAEASKKHRLGRLVSISIGDQPEVAIYIRNQARGAAKAVAMATSSRVVRGIIDMSLRGWKEECASGSRLATLNSTT